MNEPHTTSVPLRPLGGSAGASAPAPVRTAAKAGAHRTMTGHAVRLGSPQAGGDLLEIGRRLGVGDDRRRAAARCGRSEGRRHLAGVGCADVGSV